MAAATGFPMPDLTRSGTYPPPAPGLAGRLLRHVRENLAACLALGVRVSAAALAWLLQIVLARALGADEYGTFSFAWNILMLAGFLAPLGFGQIAVRFLARYQETDEKALARGFLRLATGATLMGSLTAAALLLLAFPLFEQGYGAICCSVLAIGLIALPFFALGDLFEGIARSQGWTMRALVPPYILRHSVMIAALLAALAIGWLPDARFAMLTALAATILAASLQFVAVIVPLSRLFPAVPPAYALREWRQAARPTLLAEIALLARQNIDLILLGLLASPAIVGIYFAATRLASLIGLIEFAVTAAFGHRFARSVAQATTPSTPIAGLAPVFARARRLALIPGLAATTLIMLATPAILGLFGPEFVNGTAAALILLGASAIRLMLGPAEDALSMAGFPEAGWRANASGALVTATLCLALAPSHGATGAALAAACGGFAAQTSLAFALRRHLGINPFQAARSPG